MTTLTASYYSVGMEGPLASYDGRKHNSSAVSRPLLPRGHVRRFELVIRYFHSNSDATPAI